MAADGIHPITLGSIVSIPKNESGLILFDLSQFAASNRSLNVISKARCRVMPIGMVPSGQSPSVECLEITNSKKCSVAITHFKGQLKADNVSIKVDGSL
jgi:hypothetical protein